MTLVNGMKCDPIALIVTGDDVVLGLGRNTIAGPGPYRRSWPLLGGSRRTGRRRDVRPWTGCARQC